MWATTTANWSYVTANSTWASPVVYAAGPPIEPENREETNREWLDRRVQEICNYWK